MPHATFDSLDLTTFAGFDKLGLEATGQLLTVTRRVAAGGVGQEIGLTLLRFKDVLLVAAVGAGSALLAAQLVSVAVQSARRE